MDQKYPKEVRANEDNDLLFRTTAKGSSESEEDKKRRNQDQIPMNEAGPTSGPLEYFTE